MYKIIVSVWWPKLLFWRSKINFLMEQMRFLMKKRLWPASTSDMVGKTRLQSWLFLETRILTIIVGMHILLCFHIYVYACFHGCLHM